MRNRMHKEYLKFWNEERKSKAAELGLTPVEVAILASIVQKETSKNDEKERVAGVYLNRLRIGMPLQADPTVVFAKKLYTNDFNQVIKRVYHKDTELDSPYNTYQNVGLPQDQSSCLTKEQLMRYYMLKNTIISIFVLVWSEWDTMSLQLH